MLVSMQRIGLALDTCCIGWSALGTMGITGAKTWQKGLRAIPVSRLWIPIQMGARLVFYVSCSLRCDTQRHDCIRDVWNTRPVSCLYVDPKSARISCIYTLNHIIVHEHTDNYSRHSHIPIMHTSIPILLAAVVSFAQAQTPTGFTPKVDTKLEVAFNSTTVNTPGTMLSKSGMFHPIRRR